MKPFEDEVDARDDYGDYVKPELESRCSNCGAPVSVSDGGDEAYAPGERMSRRDHDALRWYREVLMPRLMPAVREGQAILGRTFIEGR